MLGHLVFVEHGADGEANLGGSAQRLGLAVDGGGDPGQIALGGLYEVLALAGALAGQGGVAANNQPLAGKLGWVTAAMSRSSNSDICRNPPLTKPCSAGARSAVIQSRPAGRRVSSMRACVIMPRSPTSTTWSRANRRFSLAT